MANITAAIALGITNSNSVLLARHGIQTSENTSEMGQISVA
jgi:hypothetical protein